MNCLEPSVLQQSDTKYAKRRCLNIGLILYPISREESGEKVVVMYFSPKENQQLPGFDTQSEGHVSET